MAMESFATPYPLVFSDVDQEVDKGHIGIHSVLSFKRFQAQLSRLIGIPANQLSAVFVCRRTSSRDTDKRQKLPINENTNFNIILNQHNPSKEKDCHFLVSLKKSKKERKGARRKNTEVENADDDDSTSSRGDTSPASQRPSKEVDDAFAFEASSPNSVLDQQPLDDSSSTVSTPKHVTVGEEENNITTEVNSSQGPKEEEQPEKIIATTTFIAGTKQQKPHPEVSPPVTRIGGQLLSRSSGELQHKFGAIGTVNFANKPEQQQPQPVFHNPVMLSDAAMNQARFKDPPLQGRPGMGLQRLNGVPVFPDGVNMRLLTGRGGSSPATGTGGANANFHQHQVISPPNFHNLTHFQDQQQQHARYFNFQQQQQQHRYNRSPTTMVPASLAGVGDGYGSRGGEQFCPDCLSYKERNIRPPPFHCCINDRITTGFRGPSPAGPIERPIKRQVKAAA